MNILKIAPAGAPPDQNSIEMTHLQPQSQPLPPNRQKKGFSIMSFLERRMNQASHFIKGFDLYGQPISLHYQGEDTFKTCPGGLISMVVLLIILMYGLLKGRAMLKREDWSLIQQTVVSSVHELNQPYDFKAESYSNISIAVQFYERKAKQTAALKNLAALPQLGPEGEDNGFGKKVGDFRNLQSKKELKLEEYQNQADQPVQTPYSLKVDSITPYMLLVGMFETKADSQYATYNDINENIYTWKQYNDSSVITNSHGLQELVFNLYDATLMGSGNHIEKMQEVISRYQIRLDSQKLREDAYVNCTLDEKCSSELNLTPIEIVERIVQSKLAAQAETGEDPTDYITQMYEAEANYNISTFYQYFEYYYTYVAIQETTELSRIKDEAESALYTKYVASGTVVNTGEDFDVCPFVQKYLPCQAHFEATDLQQANAIRDQIYVISAKIAQAERWESNYNAYASYINDLFSEFEFELVIYDEVEYFKKYNHPEFHYPYSRRKTKMGTFSFNIIIDETTYDYEYFSKTVSFRLSQICLETNPLYLHEDFVNSIKETIQNFQWSQIDIFSIPSGLTKMFGGDASKFEFKEPAPEADDGFLSGCSSTTFQKIKYIKDIDTSKNYLDDYELGLFSNKMLLEVTLQLDPFKTISERVSTSVLDYLGDLGGFYGAIDLLVFMIGQFFSSKLFLASIAAKFYSQKLNAEQVKKKKKQQKKQKKQEIQEKLTANKHDSSIMEFFGNRDSSTQLAPAQKEPEGNFDLELIQLHFDEIKISLRHLLLDPIMGFFFAPMKLCCKNIGFFQRPKVLERCGDKYANELEITSLINRLRDIHGMISGLQSKEQKQLLRYTKDRVINLEEETSSEDWTDSTSQEEEDEQEVRVKKTKYSEDIDHAIGYSIVKSIGLNHELKKEMLKKYQFVKRGEIKDQLKRNLLKKMSIKKFPQEDKKIKSQENNDQLFNSYEEEKVEDNEQKYDETEFKDETKSHSQISRYVIINQQKSSFLQEPTQERVDESQNDFYDELDDQLEDEEQNYYK